jgi:type IV secretory pathway VirJ component
VLIGYSWGADVLPAIANRLSPPTRDGVSEVAVIGFSGHENFHFHFASWLGQQVGKGYPANPELRRLALSGMPILCVNGTQEKERGCEGISARAMRTVLLPTSHRFDDFMDEIGDLVAAGAVPRAPLATPADHVDVAATARGSGD